MNIGDRIPEVLGIDQDFCLRDKSRREIKSSDYRGRKLVLYSYPKEIKTKIHAEQILDYIKR